MLVHELEVGQHFASRYTLLSSLGAGGFGEVWRARDELGEGQVAIKLLHAEHEDDPTHRERFDREIRVGVWLNHPAIPRVVDAGRDPVSGRLYFAMEIARGEPLGRLPMTLRDILVAFDLLLDALAYAHARGVIHRDLKPENVFASHAEDWSVGLLDFGIVRIVGGMLQDVVGSEESEGALGSAFWMSPEQAAGRAGSVGPASDLYSIGIMLYEQLAGEVPFQGALASVLFHHFMSPPPAFVPREGLPQPLPDSLLDLVHWMMAKSYVDRPEFAADVRRKLAEVLSTLDHDPTAMPAAPIVSPSDATLAATADGPGVSGSRTANPLAFSRQTMAVSGSRHENDELSRALLHLVEPPLTGRDEEQRRLSDFARTAIGGTAAACLITAPAGTGKTRLARWLAEDVHRRGQMRVIRVPLDRVGSLTGALRLGLYRALRSPLLERKEIETRVTESLAMDSEDASALGDFLVAGLRDEDRKAAGVLAPIPPPISTITTRQFSRHPGIRPLLVWIDGIGHDDAAAVGYWIARLLSESRQHGEPIGVLWSVDADPAHLAHLLQQPDVTHVQLGSLSDLACMELVSSLLPELSTSQLASLTSRADNSPLILRELALQWATGGEESLPSSVNDIADAVQANLSRVFAQFGEALQEVVWNLALLGRSFGRSLVEHIFSEVGTSSVDLVSQSVLAHEPDGHELMFASQSLYRTVLERALASDNLDALLQRALTVRISASLDASGLSDWSLARRHLLTAWEMLDTANVTAIATGRVRILDALARVSFRQRERGALLETASSLLALSAESQRPGDVALAQLWFAIAAGLAEDFDDADACCSAAHEAAMQSGDDVIIARVTHRQGVIARAKGELAIAVALLRNAERLAERFSARRSTLAGRWQTLTLADIRRDLGVTLQTRGERSAAEEALAGAMFGYREGGDKQFVARTLLQVVRLERDALGAGSGNADIAADSLREAASLLEALDDRTGQAMLAWEAGRLQLAVGNRDAAQRSLHRAATLFGACGLRSGRAAALNTLGEMLRADGRLAEARDAYLAFEALADEIRLPLHQAAARINLGWVLLAQGVSDVASLRFEQALEILGEDAPDGYRVPATVGYAQSLSRQSPEQAAAILEALGCDQLDDDSRAALQEMGLDPNPRLRTAAAAVLASVDAA